MWYACARACSVASVSSDSLRFPHRLYASRLLCPWNFPGKKTCVGCHAFLQGIFPTQRLNPGVPHCRQILYCLRHQGSPLKCFAIWPNSERVCLDFQSSDWTMSLANTKYFFLHTCNILLANYSLMTNLDDSEGLYIKEGQQSPF